MLSSPPWNWVSLVAIDLSIIVTNVTLSTMFAIELDHCDCSAITVRSSSIDLSSNMQMERTPRLYQRNTGIRKFIHTFGMSLQISKIVGAWHRVDGIHA